MRSPTGYASRSDHMPTREDVDRHTRLLRIAGKVSSAWILERLAVELDLK